MRNLLFFSGLALLFGCKAAEETNKNYRSDNIVIQQVKNNVYQHISYLQTEDFGKVPCNGMIVFDKGEAIVFDTPANDTASAALINWVQDSLRCRVKAVVATHFHLDCVGGLAEFHRHHIPSYATHRTIALAQEQHFPLPANGFDDSLLLRAGNRDVIAAFSGEGHTRDNITGYFPSEKVMFGGCLIKEMNAGMGFLGDANTLAWPGTVMKLKEKYPEVEVVIPGHGETGNKALLDYTIQLLEKYNRRQDSLQLQKAG